ncbi:hypothetical protein MW887_002118 [Aspergillus wentii]|nr:hypothetical protein MW887_002118 [Aspergillus wentii]
MRKTYLLFLLRLFTTASSRAIHTASNTTLVPRSSAEVNDRRCDCYLVSGPEPGYFQNYRLWDFRNVPLHVNQENLDDYDDNPTEGEIIEDAGIGGNLSVNSILLSQTPFAKDWKSQAWHREGSSLGPVPILNSKWNVFFARDPSERHGPDSTYLVLRTKRLRDHTSTAEIESRLRNIFRCSFRVRLRILAPYSDQVPDAGVTNGQMATGGACAGIFSYHSANCESDIEILTSGPRNIVHLANQPDYDPNTDQKIPGASTVARIRKPWTSWVTHRLDWLTDHSRWYADRDMLNTKTYQVPNKPSMMAINLWSDGGSWTGDMNVGDSVYMAIEWIQMVYNVSARTDDLPDGIPLQRHAHGLKSNLTLMQAVFDDQTGSSGPVSPDQKKKKKKNKKKKNRKGKNGHGCRRPCWVDDYP